MAAREGGFVMSIDIASVRYPEGPVTLMALDECSEFPRVMEVDMTTYRERLKAGVHDAEKQAAKEAAAKQEKKQAAAEAKAERAKS